MYRRYNTLCFLVNWSTLIEEEAGSGPSTVTLAAAVLLSNMSLNTAFLVLTVTHYWKSQIFVQKFNFDKTSLFFSGNQSCQQLKSACSQHFNEIFAQIFFDNFSREMKVVNS